MKRSVLISLALACLAITLVAPQVGRAYLPAEQRVRFAPVHIYLDSGDAALAAYQFELKAKPGSIKIVGVEGGEHRAFKDAPYYDPAALRNDRIIIAAFNTGRNLPEGRTRIATLHLQIIGDADPDYTLKLIVAGNADGQDLPAELTLERGANR